ncbi:MAG: hypothetical protein HZB51_34335 [Chloroflexi bacterium]|nr:hypothetical protein [Chloroflexota bacterium]
MNDQTDPQSSSEKIEEEYLCLSCWRIHKASQVKTGNDPMTGEQKICPDCGGICIPVEPKDIHLPKP